MTLPFVVRTVQPVLIELDREMEEAVASLGAGRLSIFARIIFPNLPPGHPLPASRSPSRGRWASSAPSLISGNILLDTEVSSVYIFSQIESDNVMEPRPCRSSCLRCRSWRCSGSAASGAGRRGTMPARYLLRFLAVGYAERRPHPARDRVQARVRRRARRSLGGGHDAGREARVPADDPDRSNRGSVQHDLRDPLRARNRSPPPSRHGAREQRRRLCRSRSRQSW